MEHGQHFAFSKFAALPGNLIRDNASFIMLFNMDHSNLKHAYDEQVNVDIPHDCDKFRRLCVHRWKKPYIASGL